MKKYFTKKESPPAEAIYKPEDTEKRENIKSVFPRNSVDALNPGKNVATPASGSGFSKRNTGQSSGCQPVTVCQTCTCCKSTHSVCKCDPYDNRPQIQTLLKPISCSGPYEKEHFSSRFQLKKIIPPKWISCGGKILCFFAYYQESIFYSALETYRVHNCEIRFYLEDDTIEVVEPKTFDPGFPQGRVISRCRIPCPAPADNSYYTLDHLVVGCEIEFFGKIFYIQGCNDSTRQFLNREAYRVGPNMGMPEDPATEIRKEMFQTQFPRKAYDNRDAQQRTKFTEFYQKVLRFWAYWVDDELTRKFVLYYYLADDTIEIMERYEPNSGFTESPVFLNRGKLLKDFNKLILPPGIKEEALKVLNVSAENPCSCSASGDTFLLDPLAANAMEELECYKTEDLAIGAAINVYGRAFVLVDCDEFTKNYCRDKYGVEDFTPLEIPADPRDPPPLEIPPNGFGVSPNIGSEEDTCSNLDRMIPKRPIKNIALEFIHEKDILNFAAQLYNPLQNVSKDRRFTIRYFIANGTIQILEKPHRNTGFPHGPFLSRGRFKLRPDDADSRWIGCEDLFIGNIIAINGFVFQLTDADEFSMSLMEKLYQKFPHCNLDLILPKLRESLGHLQAQDVLSAFSCSDTQNMGIQAPEDFRNLIMHFTQCGLSEQEVRTLIRGFRIVHPDCVPDMDALQCIIQNELSRFNFDKALLNQLRHSIAHYDACHTGIVDRETLRKSLKGNRLPVALELIDFLVDNFPSIDCCDRVCYEHVMQFLDWECHRCFSTLPTAIPCVRKYIEPKPPMKITCVNYRALLEAVCPNFKCHLDSICPCPLPEPSCNQFEDDCYPCPDPECKDVEELENFQDFKFNIRNLQ